MLSTQNQTAESLSFCKQGKRRLVWSLCGGRGEGVWGGDRHSVSRRALSPSDDTAGVVGVQKSWGGSQRDLLGRSQAALPVGPGDRMDGTVGQGGFGKGSTWAGKQECEFSLWAWVPGFRLEALAGDCPLPPRVSLPPVRLCHLGDFTFLLRGLCLFPGCCFFSVLCPARVFVCSPPPRASPTLPFPLSLPVLAHSTAPAAGPSSHLR